MNIREIKVKEYETIVRAELAKNVYAIISVHNTKMGPALGGCRFFNYATENDALTDVLRLSEGMTYKSAMAELPLGGGKSIIVGDVTKHKTKELLEAFGEFVDTLHGRYITAKDVGIDVPDLDIMATKTQYVRGTSSKESSGDPSPMTAYGVFQGLKAATRFKFGSDNLKGKRVFIQGLGHVGMGVAKHLAEAGAQILASDMNPEFLTRAQKNFGIEALPLEAWLTTKADIFCPCAMGGILNKQTIKALVANGVKIVAGGANNQLLSIPQDSQLLHEAGILFAPDYIINAGGVINIACEIMKADAQKARQMTEHIDEIVTLIFERAKRENSSPAIVSLQMAREKVGLSPVSI